MNMISELRRRVLTTGEATLTADEYNQLQREWITRTGAEDMVAAERERCANLVDDACAYTGGHGEPGTPSGDTLAKLIRKQANTEGQRP